MKYNGVDYNEQWVLKLTLDEFVKHPATQRLFAHNNDAHLKHVWYLIHEMNVPRMTRSTDTGNYNPLRNHHES